MPKQLFTSLLLNSLFSIFKVSRRLFSFISSCEVFNPLSNRKFQELLWYITMLLIIQKQCTRAQEKSISTRTISIDGVSRKKSSSPKELTIFQQKKKKYNHLHEQFWIYSFKQNALKMTDRVWYDKMLEEEMFPNLLLSIFQI